MSSIHIPIIRKHLQEHHHQEKNKSQSFSPCFLVIVDKDQLGALVYDKYEINNFCFHSDNKYSHDSYYSFHHFPFPYFLLLAKK
jgi:hypothetical protein